MPKSHDAKPRNKARRQKYQSFLKDLTRAQDQRKRPREFVGPLFPVAAKRQAARRLLREHYQQAVKAQRELEASLREVGIKWRALEKAVVQMAGGKWSEMNNGLIEKLFEQYGMKLPVAA